MILAQRLEELVGDGPEGISLWERLSSASGRMPAGNGHPSAKSRPPATLTVVVLVMEITSAARESAVDLAGRVGADVPANLRLVVDAIEEHPHRPDLECWWADALADWIARSRLALGQVPTLLRSVYGAVCPSCREPTARVRMNGETWLVPAIGIDWTDDGADGFEVHAVRCRACGLAWLRGLDLDELIAVTLAANVQVPVLAV